MNSKLITLDGPSGVGKTTIGKKLASDLNLDFISSGMLYRAIASHFDIKGVNSFNEIQLTSKEPITFVIDGETYTEKLLYFIRYLYYNFVSWMNKYIQKNGDIQSGYSRSYIYMQHVS